MGGGYVPGTIPQVLGALSVLLASVNVSGGFVITKRMLDMFKRKFKVLLWYYMRNKSQTHRYVQVRLTHRNITGYTRSRRSCSPVASLLLPQSLTLASRFPFGQVLFDVRTLNFEIGGIECVGRRFSLSGNIGGG